MSTDSPEPSPEAPPLLERTLGPNTRTRWQRALYTVIFEHDTPAGRAFDVALIVAIGISVVAVMLESVSSIRATFGGVLRTAEWVLTALFSIEYVLRLLCVARPARYATSFFGFIDLMAILPTYLNVLYPGAHYLVVVRVLRVLRVFRILKLVQYLKEAESLGRALWASRRKISVFLLAVASLVTILGSLMYVVEGREHGFDNIPRSIYWAVVTLTTVGYGDISPQTPLGQALATVVMILGYGIIAVPTGIVTAELTLAGRSDGRSCPRCETLVARPEARYCDRCATALP